MSRIGRTPITLPTGVTLTQVDGLITVTGPKGTLTTPLMKGLKLTLDESSVTVTLAVESAITQPLYGLQRTLVANMVKGVSEGFERQLEIHGVGYRASVTGQSMNLNLGFSHPIVFALPAGIEAKVERNLITVGGFDKQLVGQVAANLRALKPPEPYKGKGIKYVEERIRRKAGKTATKG